MKINIFRLLHLTLKGGYGSGNFGHAGVPGKVGGSASEGGTSSPIYDSHIEKIKNYIDEYKSEGNEKSANELSNVLAKLEKGDIDGAIKSFQESSVKYDIPNTYTNLERARDEDKVNAEAGKDWGLTPGKYEVWRSGNLDSKRGIFFSIDKEGAESYSQIRGTKAKKYTVEIKNPLVAKRLEDAYAVLTGRTKKEILEERDSADNVQEWWKRTDRKIFDLAKEKGYDSITYTYPAPPAIKEMVVFSKSAIRE